MRKRGASVTDLPHMTLLIRHAGAEQSTVRRRRRGGLTGGRRVEVGSEGDIGTVLLDCIMDNEKEEEPR